MYYSIFSSSLKVVISSFGAELMDISSLNGKKFLYQGDCSYWKGRAPWLFPFIGKMYKNEYVSDNKIYISSLHGFISLREFSLFHIEKEKVIFVYTSTETDYKIYPFYFKLFVTYLIENNNLKLEVKVVNNDLKKMIFSLGFHPGFLINGFMEEVYLKFKKSFCKLFALSSNNLILNQKFFRYSIPKNGVIINPNFFIYDTMIFGDWGNEVKFYDLKRNVKVSLKTNDFPYLFVWQSHEDNVPFLCVEPCSSLPSNEKELVNLQNKKDFIHLEKDLSYKFEISLDFESL